MDDDPESALVADLRSLAGPGAAAGNAFSIVHDRLRIEVSYVTGSSKSLTLTARYDQVAHRRPSPRGYRDAVPPKLGATRPLGLVLRPELAHDVAAKREGVSVEWQSGDGAFDARVYVETPTTDAAVLGAVLNAEVRAAVLALMALGFLRVCIDDDGEVSARIVEFTQRGPVAPGRGRQAVEAFARLLGNLPALTHTGASHPPTPLAGLTRLLGVLGLLGWALNVGWVGLVAMAFHAISPPPANTIDSLSAGAIVASVGLGLVAGVLGGKGYGDLLRPRLRGRSDAHSVLVTAQISAFGGASVLTFTAALIAAMALSRR
jgi:hypothetical protein